MEGERPKVKPAWRHPVVPLGYLVTPAEAGVSGGFVQMPEMPAFAGMT